jgi:hypothetical protein
VVAPVNPIPVIVTVVPPAIGPADGLIAVTIGLLYDGDADARPTWPQTGSNAAVKTSSNPVAARSVRSQYGLRRDFIPP